MALNPVWEEAWLSHAREIQRGWLAFLGRDNRYPREFMIPSSWSQGGRKRWSVSNSHDLLKGLWEHAPRMDVWIGMRPTHEYYQDDPTHTRLWIDVDAKGNLEYAREKAISAREWCRAVFQVEPYVQFSAGKGFHLHFDHGAVYAQPEQLREAVRRLLADVGLDADDVDLNVVGNTRAMPRPPYTINTGDVRNGLRFTVPVDPDWSLEKIIEASESIRIDDVRVPRSKSAGSLLQEVVDEIPIVEKGEGISDAGLKTLVSEAVQFSEKIAPYVKDGRKRLLRHLVVPAYLHSEKSEPEAKEKILAFVKRSGADPGHYRAYVDGMVRSAHLHDGRIIFPMRVRRLMVKYPDIIRAIRK